MSLQTWLDAALYWGDWSAKVLHQRVQRSVGGVHVPCVDELDDGHGTVFSVRYNGGERETAIRHRTLRSCLHVLLVQHLHDVQEGRLWIRQHALHHQMLQLLLRRQPVLAGDGLVLLRQLAQLMADRVHLHGHLGHDAEVEAGALQAQNRSACCCSLARITSPSALTSSTSTSWSMDSPKRRTR
jgi:hypothetical protein